MLDESNIISLVKQELELTESLEDYLEAIYKIILKKNGVRVKDIAAELKVRNSSVTSALKALEKRALVNYEPYGVISLTKAGLDVALRITEKHRLFKYFLMNVLGIDGVTADSMACAMEHIVPKKVYDRFLQFIRYIHTVDGDNGDFIAGFLTYRETDVLENGTNQTLDAYFESADFDIKEDSVATEHD